jgi:catechol 2,3-dioxygenase-like lactoylglutathione lyase family enzyme
MSTGITIHQTFLPHDDPDASLALYRDALGFEVRGDVGYEGSPAVRLLGPGQAPPCPTPPTGNQETHANRVVGTHDLRSDHD